MTWLSMAMSSGGMGGMYFLRSVPPEIYYTLAQAYQRKGDAAQSAKYFNLTKVHEMNLAQRQKEIRDVGTGDEKHKTDSSCQQIQRRLFLV